MSEEMAAPAEGAVSEEVSLDSQSADDAASQLLGEEPAAEEEVSEDSESEESVEEEGSEEDAVEEEIKELKKKLKLKIDGEEVEEEVDFNDEESLKRHLQKAKAFDKRSQELADLRNQVNDFVSQLKNNPTAILGELGLDVDGMIENYINDKVAEAEKSPEQREREELEAKLRKLEEEREELKKSQEEQRMEQLKNQYAAEIESDISSALDNAETILPRGNPLVVKRVAETMMLALNNGYDQVTAKDVIPLVEEQFKKDLQSMFDVFPEEVIERVVGQKNLDRLRKKRISQSRSKKKVKTTTAKQIAKDSGEKPKVELSEPEKVAMKDFFDFRS